MQKKVIFSSKEQVTLTDMNDLGQFPRNAFDAILNDLGPGKTFTGFPVVASAAFQVTVGNGRLYMPDGTMYENTTDGGEIIDLLALAPLVTEKYVAIAVFGTQSDSTPEPRAFLVNATDRTTTSRVVSTISDRHANIAPVPGLEAPSPVVPGVAANYVIVAYVLLSTTGILTITVPGDFRAQSLALHTSRLNGLDAWRIQAGTRLDTLATDIAGLAGRIGNLAPLGFVLNVAADVAHLRELQKLPSTFSAYASDHYLTTDYSDLTHVDYLAKVEEGVRFPDAAVRVAQVGLQNPIDASVAIASGFMLPAWDDSVRISSVGRDSEISISQYQTQTITWQLLTKTRARIRYGAPFTVCSNGVWWYSPSGNEQPWAAGTIMGGNSGFTVNSDLIYDPIKNIFTRTSTGETFQLLSLSDAPDTTHAYIRLVQFWVDEIPDSQYWDRIVTTDGLNGSVISQSFLNSQGGWLVGVDLYFTRVGTAGDVNLLVCECDATGVPRTDRVLGTATVTAANLKAASGTTSADQLVPTNFPLIPIYLARGKRYGFSVQTNGNHYLAETVNNKYAQGSRFQMTDGAFQMGDPTHDLSFQLHFAKFRVSRLEVQLLPLQLDGGIAGIDINVDSIRPGSCGTEYQVQVNGVWTALSAANINQLNGLPAMLLFRVVFTGTVDEMPGIGVLSNSQITTSRPRSDFRHISTARVPPAAVTTVQVTVRLEYWRGPPHHVHTLELLTGAGYATLRTPAAVTDTVPQDDPNALERKYSFTSLPSITAFKIRQEGTTDNVVATYHVADRIDIDLA